MNDIKKHRRRLAAFGVAAALAALPAGTAAAAPAAEADRLELRGGDGFSFEAFKQPYDRLMAAVDSGRVDRSLGDKATALWLSLREELLAFDARIAALKLEAKQHDAPRQERALQDLTRAAAARERVLGRYVRALEELAQAKPAAAAQPAKRSGGGVTIEFVPEDVSNGGTN